MFRVIQKVDYYLFSALLSYKQALADDDGDHDDDKHFCNICSYAYNSSAVPAKKSLCKFHTLIVHEFDIAYFAKLLLTDITWYV